MLVLDPKTADLDGGGAAPLGPADGSASVTVSAYAPQADGAGRDGEAAATTSSSSSSSATGSGSNGGGGPGWPYQLVVVVEERWKRRWVGAPRKLCHASTYEARSPGGGGGSSGSGGVVLVLGLRDCRTEARRPAASLGKDTFLALASRAGAALDPAFAITELPSGFEHLGKE